MQETSFRSVINQPRAQGGLPDQPSARKAHDNTSESCQQSQEERGSPTSLAVRPGVDGGPDPFTASQNPSDSQGRGKTRAILERL